MAGRVLANLIMATGAVLGRACVQAWQQAIINGKKAGMTPENVGTMTSSVRRGAQMSLEEAHLILGVDPKAKVAAEEVLRRYKHLYEVNEKHGSFYLQSKVYRAYERLENEGVIPKGFAASGVEEEAKGGSAEGGEEAGKK